MATLEQIIDEARSLSPAEKRKLRHVLDLELEQATSQDRAHPTHSDNGDAATRERRLEWLKSHREEYGGQYVALDGDQFLAVGPNYRIAREKAMVVGKPNAFVTYLPKPDEIAEMGVGRELPTFLHGVG
jgi:hypothetical protein